MCLGDDVGLGAAGQPLVVPIGGQRIGIGHRADVADSPHAPRAGAHHHEVVARLRRQHRVAVGFRLAIEQVLAHRRDDLDVDARRLQARNHAHEIDRGVGALRYDIAVARLTRREVADDVQALGGRLEVGVGKLAAVGDGKIGARHFQDDDADLRIAGGDFRSSEIARRHVVVIPEAQVDGLAAREQLPYLRRENAEVGAGVGGRLRPGMPGQDVQHPHAETAVLALLAPHPRRQVHERREGAIRAAQRPQAGELLRVQTGALAHQADRR